MSSFSSHRGLLSLFVTPSVEVGPLIHVLFLNNVE